MNKSVVFIIILLVIVLSIIVSQYFHKRHHEYKMADIEKAIRKAFENQKAKKGFSIVEVLSTCPTNWGLTPEEAIKRLQTDMIPYYPLGVYKDRSAANKE